MKEKEMAILKGIKNLPKSGYGNFHYEEELANVIASVMGYEAIKMRSGHTQYKEECKIGEIIRRMKDKGIIKYSASGSMFKLV